MVLLPHFPRMSPVPYLKPFLSPMSLICYHRPLFHSSPSAMRNRFVSSILPAFSIDTCSLQLTYQYVVSYFVSFTSAMLHFPFFLVYVILTSLFHPNLPIANYHPIFPFHSQNFETSHCLSSPTYRYSRNHFTKETDKNTK